MRLFVQNFMIVHLNGRSARHLIAFGDMTQDIARA